MEKIGCKFGLSYKRAYQGMAFAALSGLLLGMAGIPAHADKIMKSSEESVEITLNHDLSTETAHYGDPFDGTLTETYRLGEKVLPAGTVLKGQVHSGHPSMILGMPGYVALDIQEAVMPSGAVYKFSTDGKGGLKTEKYHHPKAHTGKGLLLAAIPFSAVSALDALPLKLAAGMGFWEITPISLAARMALGVGLEMNDKKKQSPAANYPIQTRVGYGMLRGTGLTGAYHFVTTSPEPNLKEGAVIPVHLPKQHMDKLFEAGEPVKTVEATPKATPVSVEDLKPAEVESQGFESVHGKIPTAASTPAVTEEPAQEQVSSPQ